MYILDQNTDNAPEVQKNIKSFALQKQCIESDVPSIKTATEVDDVLLQLKNITVDLHQFLKTTQSQPLFEFRLLIRNRARSVRPNEHLCLRPRSFHKRRSSTLDSDMAMLKLSAVDVPQFVAV